MTDEKQLLQRAKKFEDAAIAELYDKYAPMIYRYLYRRVSDEHVAEDLTGDVFLRALEAIQNENFWHTSFRAWIYRIAHNLVVDHYRDKSSEDLLPLDERLIASVEMPESAKADPLSFRRLRLAMRQLTPSQEQVIVLRFGEQLTAREVAEIMGKSTGAVELLQHRALKKMRRFLETDQA
ncbi:MAG: sigma-70 family RNA polymerase sigma factor [Chloroflexi bacterium]|jgi:RNA polymerase sigma-70 factor (ECF subfamily)|nr:sigma-70 family RNA polymerase sigma factor [Chloroflexota bacterium]